MDFVVTDTPTTEIYTYGHTLSLPDALPIDPAGGARAMALVRESFETGAACLYSLDYQRRRIRPVEVGHIAPRFLGSFAARFYTDDNPSARTPPLHRPGIVRTAQRLGDYFRAAEILTRSRSTPSWLPPHAVAPTIAQA